ncbi:MAG TPA: AAC(3) family N-acetyltransferase, partial [Gemmatimonadales bacterium]|nr:AAC(3) family N-acetyltransferase [Gemmatimonadales bacterium]
MPVADAQHRPATALSRESTILGALRSAGVRLGDTIMVHVNLASLGWEDDAATHQALFRALRTATGPDGTIVVPVYTFSFCRQELFDPASTPTMGGMWSPSAGFLEYFRQQPGVARSGDPIHSVAALGPGADALVADVAPTCFGDGSVFQRLVAADALIAMVGLGLDEATIRHHAEELAGAPFRYRKLFTGRVRQNGREQKRGWIYNVRILARAGYPDGTRFEAEALRTGIAQRIPIGQGALVAARSKPLHDLTLRVLAEDPWSTAQGPAGDPIALEQARVGGQLPA